MTGSDARATTQAADFLVGGWTVRPSVNEISSRGVTRHLRSQLMDLLVLLAAHAGQVVSRAEIHDRLWGSRFVSDTVLPRCLAELRDLLGDDIHYPAFIETIPKRGYRLVAPVVERIETPLRTKQPGVLVLPFRDLTEEGDQQFFCDGLAEQIINALAHVRGLRVISRQSAFLLREAASDRDVIRASVGADMIVEGSIRKAGDQIRVNVQLVDCASDVYAWVESFEGRDRSIFEFQDRIALAVAEKLQVEIIGPERNGVLRRYTDDVDAHTMYLKGLYHWNRRTRDDMRLCRECFQRAIESDPRFPLPYVALADGYTVSALYGFVASDALVEARRLAEHALQLDPELGQAHASIGFTKFLDQWNIAAAEPSFKTALALNPSYGVAYAWYALAVSWAGRMQQADDLLERAYVSDPLSPLLGTTRGVLLSYRNRYDDASRQYREVLAIHPDYSLAHLHLARALLALGRFDDAVAHAQTLKGLGMPASGLCLAGLAQAQAGRRDAARAELDALLEMSRAAYAPPALIAPLHFALDDREGALRWFAEAKRLRDPLLVPFVRDPYTERWLSPIDMRPFLPENVANPVPA